MKKLFTIMIFIMVGLLLSSCGPRNNEDDEEIQLDKIKQDEDLKDLLYNEVCFNVYTIDEKYNKVHYQHNSVKCYFIDVKDYPDSVENIELSIFETQNFSGFLKSDLYEIGKKYGAVEYEIDPDLYRPLYPICRVNDTLSDDYCISTYWKIKDGITDNYAIIHLDE